MAETVVGVTVFLLVSVAAYQGFASLLRFIATSQYRIAAINLANEQIEIIRNLPYSDVGVVGSVPAGKVQNVQELVRSGYTFIATTTIRNIDLPFDGQIGSTTNDLSPADNKLVEIEVGCTSCQNMKPVTVTAQVAPKNLETASTNGALFVRVFDAGGIPVSDAAVRVTSTTTTINDSTNAQGMLQLVDVPPAVEGYTIEVSKGGYSNDRNYTKATVLLQQVTQTSFAIDKVSKINFSSVTNNCTPVPSFDFSLRGSKTTTGPTVYKYSQNLVTDGGGEKKVSNMEWDTYTITATDGSYDLIGLNPLNPFLLSPNTEQDVKLIVAPKQPRTLLVTVKNSAQLPLSGATVTLGGTSKVTGLGSYTDTDWSAGTAITNGNIDYSSTPGEFKLTSAFGAYASNGVLESAPFDTGSASNFQKFLWAPEYQPADAGPNSLYFQIATAASSSGPWVYRGPDGSTGSYYTSPDSTINTVHNGDRYVRYKAYLSTSVSTTTPIVSDVSFIYTTACTPPGQVVFTNLSNGDYTVTVSKTGYTTAVVPVTINGSWKEQEVLLGE